MGCEVPGPFRLCRSRRTHPGSDLDFLVEFEGRAGFDKYMDLKFFLEDLLDAKVDLVTRKALKSRLRPYIEKEAINVA